MAKWDQGNVEESSQRTRFHRMQLFDDKSCTVRAQWLVIDRYRELKNRRRKKNWNQWGKWYELGWSRESEHNQQMKPGNAHSHWNKFKKSNMQMIYLLIADIVSKSIWPSDKRPVYAVLLVFILRFSWQKSCGSMVEISVKLQNHCFLCKQKSTQFGHRNLPWTFFNVYLFRWQFCASYNFQFDLFHMASLVQTLRIFPQDTKIPTIEQSIESYNGACDSCTILIISLLLWPTWMDTKVYAYLMLVSYVFCVWLLCTQNPLFHLKIA